MAATGGLGAQRARRLDAPRADLYGGPNVVVPPKHLMASSASETFATAAELEMARHHLDDEVSSVEEGSPRIASPVSQSPVTHADNFAFAFDIDGVLVKGGQPIPAAVDALKYINGENPHGVKV